MARLANDLAVKPSLLFSTLLSNILPVFITTAEVRFNASDTSGYFVSYHAPKALTYDELIEVSRSETPPVSLQPKLVALLSHPFISNEAFMLGASSKPLINESLGEFMRVGTWNIQYGQRLDDIKLGLEAPELFAQQIKAPTNDEER